jgi:hypothetical protein
MAKSKQMELTKSGSSGWGGARPGAGRKPKGERALVSHRARAVPDSRFSAHVTWRFAPEVWSAGLRRSFGEIEAAFVESAKRFDVRLIHQALKGDDVHVIVEAPDGTALAKSMQGVGIRIARGLNRMTGRRGRVFADRYELQILKSPREVRDAVDNLRGG